MDRRLYRARQLSWSLFAALMDTERVDSALWEYRTVLYEWNDSVNQTLAGAQIEFGDSVRRELEFGVWGDLKRVGEELEKRVRAQKDKPGGDPDEFEKHRIAIEAQLDAVEARIYQLNVVMLGQLRDGHIGRSAPSFNQVTNER